MSAKILPFNDITINDDLQNFEVEALID